MCERRSQTNSNEETLIKGLKCGKNIVIFLDLQNSFNRF